jgi:hypothetical protein
MFRHRSAAAHLNGGVDVSVAVSLDRYRNRIRAACIHEVCERFQSDIAYASPVELNDSSNVGLLVPKSVVVARNLEKV